MCPSPDRGAGPQITQDVLYRDPGGIIICGTIYGVNANGTVNLVSFDGAGATPRLNVSFDPNLATNNRWNYPSFQ
jgi:hypothetical protein